MPTSIERPGPQSNALAHIHVREIETMNLMQNTATQMEKTTTQAATGPGAPRKHHTARDRRPAGIRTQWLWGVWGMLLSVPIIVIVKIISEHIEPSQPVAELLGDR